MAKYRCNKCDKSFDKEQGLSMHFKRKHTAAGKTWGKGKSQSMTAATSRRGEGIQEKVRRVLASHPNGLQVKHIITELRSIGYRPSGNVSGYISTTCSTDPDLIRVERGVYRLKTIPTPEVAAQESATEEVTHSVPALLVRIEHLQTERDALRTLVSANTHAQLTFVREVGA